MASLLKASTARIETKAKFSRFNFSLDSHNPLHLGVSKGLSTQFFGDRLTSFTVVAIRPDNTGSTSYPSKLQQELFVCLRILDDDLVRKTVTLCQVTELPDTITLYASELFHSHYSIPFDVDVFVRPVKAFPLTKVVFGAKTRSCFEWAKSRVFSTGFLISVCQQRVLTRLHDAFLAPVIPAFFQDETSSLSQYLDLITIECEPVIQGVISVHTSIIITDISQSVDQSTNQELFNESLAIYQKSIPPEISMSQINGLLISDFTKDLTSKDNSLENSVSLQPIVVPLSSSVYNIMSSIGKEINPVCEVSYCIFVTKNSLMKLGTFSGSWVIVAVDQESGALLCECEPKCLGVCQSKLGADGGDSLEKLSEFGRKHICQILLYEPQQQMTSSKNTKPFKTDMEPINDDCVLISPLLWFNLQEQPAPLIQPDTFLKVMLASPETLEEGHSRGPSARSIAITCQPPTASTLHISLVKCPAYSPSSNFDEAIKKYFKTIRLVSLGDVICFSTKDFPEYMSNVGEGCETHSPVVFFKISKILPEIPGTVSYLASSLCTSVFQTGAVCSYVPITCDVYFSNRLHLIQSTPSPVGLMDELLDMETMIWPFLTKSPECDRLPGSFLLTGAVGSGKSVLVHSLCRYLNLHCYSVNCYSLCSDTSAATEARIKNAFFKASVCVPCVLLLRNVHVFSKDRDADEEDPRVVASLKETIMSHAVASKSERDWPMIVIATAPDVNLVSADLQSCFLHNLHISVEIT